MDLSSITLVILSHNRQHCLKETLQFYSGTGLKLLVLDNSPSALHHHLIPSDCRYINVDEPFATRSAMAAELIDTPFTIIGADDELYLPSSLSLMRDFLDNNKDYVAVGGYAMAVWEYGPTIAAAWAYSKTYRYHNTAENPLGRIAIHTGHGASPVTSFFTCNLTRSWAAKECLLMYSKAPVLATDAISVLTICGAGKSKYLDVVYWVRNWNQSPRSHSGWNRRVPLYEWWMDPNNSREREYFVEELSAVYSRYSSDKNFAESWGLILESDKVLDRRVAWLRLTLRTWNEIRFFKSLKYYLKFLFKQHSLPRTVSDLTYDFKIKDISIPDNELDKATRLVSKLMPYENW